MKRLLFIVCICLSSRAFTQSVAINEDASTAHPSAMLDVKSLSKGMLIPRMSTQDRTDIQNPSIGLLVFDNDTESFWYYKTTGWMELVSGGGTITSYWDTDGIHIYNNNTGNVGIGTTTPSAKLTLLTDINTTGWTHISQVDGIDSIIVSEGIGGVSAAIGTSSNHAFRLNAGGQGRISIYPAGQVVVGDNNSGSFGKFSVQTTNNTDGISHLGENGNILATRMGGTSAGIGTFSHTNMRIFSGSLSRILISEATGNVGIGTDNPINKLDVNGTIRSKEIVVETANWPDYVFSKKYKLPSLKKVEKYIQANNHLPNIPAASSFENTGLHVGETQKMMMEKIEELTLYIIHQQKEIDTLKKAVLKNK